MRALPKKSLIVLVFFAVLAMSFAAYVLLYPAHALEVALKEYLARRGITDVSFRVAAVSPHEARIESIVLGGERGLRIARAVVTYDLAQAKAGRVNAIFLGDVALTLAQEGGAWSMPALKALPATKEKTALALPFRTLSVDSLRITMAGENAEPNTLAAHGLLFSAEETPPRFTVADASYGGEQPVLYAQHITGDVDPDHEVRRVTAQLFDGEKKFSAAVSGGYDWKAGEGSLLLDVKQAAVQDVLALALKDEVRAEGNLSGSIPIHIKGGKITVGKSALIAKGGGKILYAPAAEAVAGEEMNMLLGALKNFRYTALRMSVASESERMLAADLDLEGSNPDFYDGKRVELHIHLRGDVLGMVASGLKLYDLPETLQRNLSTTR